MRGVVRGVGMAERSARPCSSESLAPGLVRPCRVEAARQQPCRTRSSVATAAVVSQLGLVLEPPVTAGLSTTPGPQAWDHGSSRAHSTRPPQVAAPSWLEQAIPELVKQLSPALQRQEQGQPAQPEACVQRVHAGPGGLVLLQHQRLNPDELSSSKTWRRLAHETDSGSSMLQPMALVLARPIPDPEHYCPFTCSSPAGSPRAESAAQLTSTAASCCSPNPAAVGGSQQACGMQEGVTELEGQVDVDNCCGGVTPNPSSLAGPSAHASQGTSPGLNSASDSTEAQLRSRAAALVAGAPSLAHSADSGSSSSGSSGDEHAPVEPSLGRRRSRRRFLRRQQVKLAMAQHAASGSAHVHAASPSSRQELYYGVAIQCLFPTAASAGGARSLDGCYVLKLSRNRDVTGCTCTVYSLTHVCRGQPLYQQLQSSWLVAAA